jgi:hypothetical protein
MKTKFKDFLNEAGAAAGKLELVKTNVDDAYAYAKSLFEKNGRDIDEELPHFKENYIIAQKQAGTGRTKRKDMPVIDAKDVKDFQRRLLAGKLDVRLPHDKHDITSSDDPFPEGLSGEEAKHFLEAGIKIHDGSKPDDKVNVNNTKITVGSLSPIQKQIYFDKSIAQIAKAGVENSKKFLTGGKTTFVTSSDQRIVDGHHRYLSGLLIDPTMKVNAISIDLPITKLLPLSLAYGDARGNKRNQ